MPSKNNKREPGISRRQFLLRSAATCGLAATAGVWGYVFYSKEPVRRSDAKIFTFRDYRTAERKVYPQLAVVHGKDAEKMVRAAMEKIGGMNRFINPGERVLLKPNAAWDRQPEQAANTNPELVAEVVRQCWQAGAKRVIVTDVSCNEPRRCFQRSGIQAAARAEGAEVILPDPDLFREVDLGGVALKSWPVFIPFLEADKILNLPIAKHHNLTGATLGMKNWYGILGGQRNRLHQQIHQSLVDLASFMLPTLTLMDCYRVLLRNGPTGGNPEDAELKKTIVAGTDPVAIDAYVAKAYWDLDPEKMPYLEMAAARGLGTTDFASLNVTVTKV